MSVAISDKVRIGSMVSSATQTGSLMIPKGMNFIVTAFFLAAQMSGAGFLALPKAIADSGWIGLPLLFIFCGSVGFAGTRLGRCWVILEERWPEYRTPARQPYMEIAYRAYGKVGRNLTLACVMITLIGTSIVYMILVSQFLNSLLPGLGFCKMTIIVGFVLVPLSWMGTPNDFWQASVFAAVATFLACYVIVAELIIQKDTFSKPVHNNPTFVSFSLSFASILFSFGGGSGFPTIQNDMKNRGEFWKSIVIAFLLLLMMYFPVAATGYILLGSDVPSNILLYNEDSMSLPVIVAIVLVIINLIVTFLIACNPISQALEEMLSLPRAFGWRRCVLRTALVLVELFVAVSFPDFALILNLVGGSTVTLCSFLFPPLFYIKLVKDSKLNKTWPQRSIPTWEKIFLWEIVFVGVIGAISATGSAIIGIINTPIGTSCLSKIF